MISSLVNNAQKAHEGLIVNCGICGGEHPLECTNISQTGEKTTDIMTFRCGDRDYIGAIDGRVVVSIVTRRRDDTPSAGC